MLFCIQEQLSHISTKRQKQSKASASLDSTLSQVF